MQPAIVKPRKLFEEIVDRIAGAIRAAEYGPGDVLPSERELMQTFGVGRSVVREALFALQRMGLVEVRSGTRARVTAPTPQRLIAELSGTVKVLLNEETGIRNLQDVRSFFEIGLARYAALHATADDLARVERALAANEAAIGRIKAFAETDVAFHYEIALIRRNPIFPAIHEAIVAWLREQRLTALKAQERDEVFRRAYAAHAAIFEAIAACDPDRAERAMEAHLAEVSDFYWRKKPSLDAEA
jgi:GntR family transcriptional repressor for pyruvate dehydrogenase complex